MMNQYPAKPMMDQMAAQGRYGDSMLVHMNPIEVAGIASLSPTGQLTTNPVTGQPEAFLPFLAPLLGMGAGALGLGTIGTAALTGVGTAALTGDIKRGLVAGITGGLLSGAGGALADALGSGADAATQVGLDTATEAAQAGLDTAAQTGLTASAETAANTASQLGLPGASMAPDMSMAATPSLGMSPVNPTAFQPQSGFDAFSNKLDTLVGGMTPMQSVMVGGLGSGQLAEMDYQDELNKDAAKLRQKGEDTQMQAFSDLQSAYSAAQPNLRPGASPARSLMSRNLPPQYIPGMAAGGMVNVTPYAYPATVTDDSSASTQFVTRAPMGAVNVEPTSFESSILAKASSGAPLSSFDQMILEDYYGRRGSEIQAAQDAYAATPATEDQIDYSNIQPMFFGGSGAAIDSVGVQAGLRGDYSVAPPKDYMAGFEPEFSYFQNDPNNIAIPDRGYRPTQGGIQSSGGYFDPILDKQNYLNQVDSYYKMLGTKPPQKAEPKQEKPKGMVEGGQVPLRTSLGEQSIQGGGIANIETEFTRQPKPEEIQMVAEALLGRIDNPDAIINMFVDKYGPEMFSELRDMVLKSTVPNAQTEGMIRGEGSGMDDMVPGMIGDQQPVAVSPGEYIVPADVVSGLGDGSSESGAKELDMLADRVRMSRGGTTKQAPPVNQSRVMPA